LEFESLVQRTGRSYSAVADVKPVYGNPNARRNQIADSLLAPVAPVPSCGATSDKPSLQRRSPRWRFEHNYLIYQERLFR
jgi:hypothetical protein